MYSIHNIYLELIACATISRKRKTRQQQRWRQQQQRRLHCALDFLPLPRSLEIFRLIVDTRDPNALSALGAVKPRFAM